MSSADTSASGRIRALKARTLATYHKTNPQVNDFGGSAKPSSALTLLLRKTGTYYDTECNFCCETVCDISGGSFGVGAFDISGTVVGAPVDLVEFCIGFFLNTSITIPIPGPESGYSTEWPAFLVEYIVGCNTTSNSLTNINLRDVGSIPFFQIPIGVYQVAPDVSIGVIGVYPMQDLSSVFQECVDPYDNSTFTFTLEGSNACSSTSGQTHLSHIDYCCFVEGSLVTMGDGSTKPIEQVNVGEVVLGAFGEKNTVMGLQKPRVGFTKVVNINNEHKTTINHPHIGPDRGFYCVDSSSLPTYVYGKDHIVIERDNKVVVRTMTGATSVPMQTLQVGTQLQTITGPRAVNTIEPVNMSPFTQVYHLAVDGSHTYIVDGYAVAGWADDKDFDYTSWTRK